MDRKLLRHLQHDPDLSVAALAEKVGLSHTPCWRRLKRMEADGIILGRALLLDPRRLGLGVDVFAHVRLKMHDEQTLEALERETLEHPQIVECFSMSGECDYVMRVVVGSIDDYERFLKKVLLHLPGVASINSSFALQRVKMTTALPV
ncbi:Lrp/AsnC family transcriptional regulator [Novosphingobium sp. BL-52-GroH]|uniref:Lrp/AsnC family transcriptional regulator n=1 Tax=Novosphingobium sp. BL-52-GroH TaxID=3349877 RepID=UPI00384DA7E1